MRGCLVFQPESARHLRINSFVCLVPGNCNDDLAWVQAGLESAARSFYKKPCCLSTAGALTTLGKAILQYSGTSGLRKANVHPHDELGQTVFLLLSHLGMHMFCLACESMGSEITPSVGCCPKYGDLQACQSPSTRSVSPGIPPCDLQEKVLVSAGGVCGIHIICATIRID